MKQFRRTKIIATIGPASRDPAILEQLIDAGLNVVRLNFSHGSHDDHRSVVETLREICNRKGVAVGILQDLQGPKIRTGRFKEGKIQLKVGDKFIITADDVEGDQERVSTTYKGLPGDVRPGLDLLLDDGNIVLKVESILRNDIVTSVVIGGPLSNNKGINIPGADLSIPALTDKDIDDLQFGLEIGVDWVAVSFVRSRDDLLLARHYLNRFSSKAKLIAKVEKPTAVERFGDLLVEADGIMVARGDLGVELPAEQVPVIQKRLITACVNAGKPVITATQMLESMINNPRPTRAEASDVANAIFDGSDAVMLSAESAAGKYPVEAVKMMDRIARNVETSPDYLKMLEEKPTPLRTTQDAVALAAYEIADTLEANAIVCFTATGSTVWRVSRNRPLAPIAAFTPLERVRNQMTLAWGVMPYLVQDPEDPDDMVKLANEMVRKTGLAETGERIVITAGVPFGVHGTTNMLRVERVQ